MKAITVAALLLSLATAGAYAQTTSPTPSAPSGTATTPSTTTAPSTSAPSNNAVNQPNTNNPGAPVAGANSFTETQAKSRLEGSGFTNVSNLRKDDSGIWRATAMKDGKQQNVSLDFQGNIVAQ